MKIAIGIPTNRQFKPQNVLSLAKLLAYSQYKYEIYIPTRGFNTAENRNQIVASAVRDGCTHILLSDDDMVFPPDSLERLLEHDKDIVGATYHVRENDPHLIIEYLDEMTDEELLKQEDLVKCGALGGGMLLIKTEVFRKVPQPHFGYKWNDNGSVKMSNDWYFCEKAREKGFKIWCDPILSREVKHVGDYEY